MSEFDEEAAVAVDPFQGDMDVNATVFSDKIVCAAKLHKEACNICGGDIQKGERHRARREACDGEVATFRFCGLCCVAMAKSLEDDGDAWEDRISLRWEREGRGLDS